MATDKSASAHRLAIVGVAYLVSLAATFALVPPAAMQYDVVLPAMSAASIMLFFGPYLLAVGCTTGFLPDSLALCGLVPVLPFYIAHVVFLSVISKRTSLWQRMGRFGEGARKATVAIIAVVSAVGVWSELPEVTQYDLAVEASKIPVDGLRLAVVSDLHSCRYGDGQRALIGAIRSQKPDAVLLVGDIFDDRLPDANTRTFLSGVAKEYPCFYVFGNHEYWSERIPEIKDILLDSGVTVLEGCVRTLSVRGVEVDICGIDDPTYLMDGAWLAELDHVAAATAASSRLKILLSHRAEYACEYEKYDFDLVFSGHLHGGQWRIPGLDVGVCGPSSGGPYSDERMFFPRRAGGAYALNDKTTLVVSRGLARESTPLPRLFNNPELVVVNLVPAN